MRNIYDSNSKGISWTGGFFMLIGFAIAGVLFSSVISIFLWTAMTGLPIDQMEELMLDPAYGNAVRVMQVVTVILGFLVPAIVAAHMMNQKPFRLLGFTGRINAGQAGLVILIMFVALFVSAFLSYINDIIPLSETLRLKFERFEMEYLQQIEAILGLKNTADYFVALVILAFLPAVCEEALFRGGLQNFLTRSTGSFWLSVILVSLIFSLAHFSYFGFLSRLFLGIVLGMIFHYSGRLWLCIIGHFINNAIAISVIYYYKLQGKSLEEAMNETSSTWMGIFALPLLIGLIYLFYRISKPVKQTEPVAELKKNENLFDGF